MRRIPGEGAPEDAAAQDFVAEDNAVHDTAASATDYRDADAKNEKLEQFLATPRLIKTSVGPDSKFVVGVVGNKGPVWDIYAAPTDGSGPERKITDFGERTWIHSWVDDKHIIAVHDYGGNEHWRLHKVNVETGESIPLTPEDPPYITQGGHVTPDGKYLVFAANRDFENEQTTDNFSIYKQDIASGDRTLLARLEKDNFIRPTMNKTGTHMLYNRSDITAEGEQMWLVDMEGKEDKEILNFGDTAKVKASWCNNDRDVLFTVEKEGLKSVGTYNIESGEIHWVVKDSDRKIDTISNPPGTDSILLTEMDDLQSSHFLIERDSSPENPKEIPLPNASDMVPLSRLEGDMWVCKSSSSNNPDALVVANIKTGEITTLLSERPKFEQKDLVKAESIHWENKDDKQRIQGWLYRAPGKAKGTIIHVHGGPTSRTEDKFDPEVQYYVDQGFNVLQPNYRGSTGFGLRFQESIKKDGWGGAEQEDILSGAQYLIDIGVAEPGKIGITGTSYGGYSSWHAITHAPKELIAAAAPCCGMTDLADDYRLVKPELKGYSVEMMGGTPDEIPEKYYERSPVHFLTHVKETGAKILNIQGWNDPNVTKEQMEAVREPLKDLGAGDQYQELIFEDEGHGITKPKNQAVMFKRVAAFFEGAFAEQAA